MMKKITVFSLTVFLTFSSVLSYGQCDNFPESFYQSIEKTPVIIEGKIVENSGELFDDNNYSSFIVEVFKVLKGDFDTEFIEIVRPNISISHGQNTGTKRGEAIGTFLLFPSDILETPKDSIPIQFKFKFNSFWTCNFIDYNRSITTTKDWKVSNKYGFKEIKDLKEKVYTPVRKSTGQKYCEVKSLEKKNCIGISQNNVFLNQKSGGSNPIITNIFPTTISAGTFDTLSIVGTGFGECQTDSIKVILPDANTGGATTIVVPQNHIKIWSDTLIQLWNPSLEVFNGSYTDSELFQAGTGKVSIEVNNVVADTSFQTLIIPYSEHTYALTDSSQVYPTRLTRNRADSTFTFMVTPEFRSDTVSMQLLEQAMEVWRCETGVNFVIDCNTSIAISCKFEGDNYSVITYRNDSCFSTLPSNVLATTLRKFRLCGDHSAYILESVDIIFNDTVLVGGTIPGSWYYNGTTTPITVDQQDFLTVAIHELGHAHLIEHIIEDSELMHFVQVSGSEGIYHTLNPLTDVIVGQSVMSRSTPDVTINCYGGMKPVVPDSCALPTCYIDDCLAPDYPLYASFTITPEECLDDPTWTPATDWQLSIGQNVSLVFQSTSDGFIDSYEWDFDDLPSFLAFPCDFASDEDTCMTAFWDSEGVRIVTLTVTDIWGCQQTFSEMINIEPIGCTMEEAILADITEPEVTCDINAATCPQADATGIISLAPFAAGVGSDCYSYFVEYHSTCECFGLDSEAIFTDNDFVYDESGAHLQCLAEGYYQVNVTDEISICVADTVFYLQLQPQNSFLITQYSLQETTFSCTSGDACNGTASVNQVNSQPLNNSYTYAWSDCTPPESCNTPDRTGLCIGSYTVSVTDIFTGCSGTRTFSLAGSIGNGSGTSGVIAGVDIDIYPAVFDNLTNVRLTLDEDSEVTVDVWHISGIHEERLLDSELKIAGEHIIEHQTDDLNSGVYIYTVQVCNQIEGKLGVKQ